MAELCGIVLAVLFLGLFIGWMLKDAYENYRADKIVYRNWKALNRRGRWHK